jgi:hypothetical protein
MFKELKKREIKERNKREVEYKFCIVWMNVSREETWLDRN